MNAATMIARGSGAGTDERDEGERRVRERVDGMSAGIGASRRELRPERRRGVGEAGGAGAQIGFVPIESRIPAT